MQRGKERVSALVVGGKYRGQTLSPRYEQVNFLACDHLSTDLSLRTETIPQTAEPYEENVENENETTGMLRQLR